MLVATCIGEEGLDIGGVDLVICFDMHSSPIRLVQRVGRTGRHQSGKVVLLLCRGKEEQKYESSMNQQKAIERAVCRTNSSFNFFKPYVGLSPRSPECIKRLFVLNTPKVPVKAPRQKARAPTANKTVTFERITREMILQAPSLSCRPFNRRTDVAVIRPSRRTESYLKLRSVFSELGDKPVKPTEKSLDQIMTSWRTAFDDHDLDRFIELTIGMFPLPEPTQELPSDDLIDGLDDIPDDFFDDLSDNDTDGMAIEDNHDYIDRMSAVKIDSSTVSSRPETPMSPTPVVFPVRKRPLAAVVNSSPLSKPVRKAEKRSPGHLTARHFVESQAYGDDSDEDDVDGDGYSELGSFIDDGEIEEDEEETEGDSNDSPPDMKAFYRQSLLHSQAACGFTTGSRFIRAPAKTDRVRLLSVPESVCEDEDVLSDLTCMDIDWDEVEKAL